MAAHRGVVVLVAALALPTLAAQTPPIRFTGNATITSELYGVHGIAARRPGSAWRLMMAPQVALFGQFDMGLNVLVSSEGSQLRQNMSQLGLNPRFGWATFHLGDFSHSYTPYTVQGTQVRGAGVDLRPGILRFSLQGGQSQRTVAGGPAGLAYRRTLYAASVGVGRDGGSFLDVTVMKAKDDASSLAGALADTTMFDTIPPALRPKIETRPQENLVLSTTGQVQTLHRRLVVRGEVAGSLVSSDLDSPRANPKGVTAGGLLDALMPLRLSTSGDYAYHVQADANLGRATLHGGVEYVGAGFTSLGLAYLINDRRTYELGGSARLMRGRVMLQGQVQHQNDNVLGQKTATTDRDAAMGSVTFLIGRRLNTSVTAMRNVIVNDAAVDTFHIDNHAFALTTNSALQGHLFGRAATYSVSYALQRTADANVITRIPDVTVHNLATSVQVAISPSVSLAPTASYALTRTESAAEQRNVYLGFRGSVRSGQLRTSAALTQTFSNSRHVFGLTGQVDYPLFPDARVSLQARHTRYGAIGNRPAFQETFATLSLARSF